MSRALRGPSGSKQVSTLDTHHLGQGRTQLRGSALTCELHQGIPFARVVRAGCSALPLIRSARVVPVSEVAPSGSTEVAEPCPGTGFPGGFGGFCRSGWWAVLEMVARFGRLPACGADTGLLGAIGRTIRYRRWARPGGCRVVGPMPVCRAVSAEQAGIGGGGHWLVRLVVCSFRQVVRLGPGR